MSNLPYGDKKFYYGIHCNKQKAMGNTPLSYNGFMWRLRKGMNLHDAIYEPRVKCQVRTKSLKPTPEDNTRRRLKLNEENVMILDFDEIDELEAKLRDKFAEDVRPMFENKIPKAKKQNKIQMPKPKKKWYIRLLDFFKKK